MSNEQEQLIESFIKLGFNAKDLEHPDKAYRKAVQHPAYAKGMDFLHADVMRVVTALSGEVAQQRDEMAEVRHHDVVEQQLQRNQENLKIQNDWKKRGKQ